MKKIIKELETLHSSLGKHPVYNELKNIESLRVFMQYHVFAVWDFMSLLKSLQREITCVDLPWKPSKYSKDMVRMVNEIVLGEESDLDLDGRPCDHFTLYLKAMKEVGADTSDIERFLVDCDLDVLPELVRPFVLFNLELALGNEPHKVAAAFFYGREKLIPDMFHGILNYIDSTKNYCPTLTYYIERHIELDGDEHSILAKKCLEELCGGDSFKIEQSYEVGKKSLELRRSLWNNVLEKLINEQLLTTT